MILVPISAHNVSIRRPYIKGLPVTLTTLEADVNGHFTERVIRPSYLDCYTIELQELYDCVMKGKVCKTGPKDAAQDLLIFDMIMAALRC